MLSAPHSGILPCGFADPILWHIYVRDFWERADCLWRCTEVQQLLVESALARRDKTTAWNMLRDWHLAQTRHARVSKFEPGSHFYVLDRKFDSYELAVNHAHSEGYTVDGTIHRVGIPRSGD